MDRLIHCRLSDAGERHSNLCLVDTMTEKDRDADANQIIHSARECGTADAVHLLVMLSLILKELRNVQDKATHT